MAAVVPSNLNELLDEVTQVIQKEPENEPSNALVSVLRRHHFWPALQVKKFFDDSKLVLLHNTYKRTDVERFQALYDECRSVILDLTAPLGQNVIVTYAHTIPTRLVVGQYKTLMVDQPASDEPICTLSYEGTVVTAYEHNGTWKFGTSTCPTVDSSRYHHPTKTHGAMFNEAIAKLIENGESPSDEAAYIAALRTKFAERLNKNYAYTFLLVHHENKHIMDYTEEFGEGYAQLLQINVRSRTTLESAEASAPQVADTGIPVPKEFGSSEEAMQYLQDNATSTYGIFIKTGDGKLYLVSSEATMHQEEVNLGNSNVWQNLLHVYMMRKPDYHIKDYLKEFKPQLTSPANSVGLKLSPTFVVHTAMCALRDVLLTSYRSSTYYDMETQKYVIRRRNSELLLPPARFHVNQLRYFQITDHKQFPIGEKAVFGYLCLHNTIKNIRILLDHVSQNPDTYTMPFESMECVRILNQQLKH